MWLTLLFGILIASSNSTLITLQCPDGGEPVCASDGLEYIYFENECQLNVYSCKQMSAGQPRPTKVALEACFSHCADIICPEIYQPVCAQQLLPPGPVRTVSNACLVNQLICETKQQWLVIANGPCSVTSELGQGTSSAAQTSYQQPSQEQSSVRETAYYPAPAQTEISAPSAPATALEQGLVSEAVHPLAPFAFTNPNLASAYNVERIPAQDQISTPSVAISSAQQPESVPQMPYSSAPPPFDSPAFIPVSYLAQTAADIFPAHEERLISEPANYPASAPNSYAAPASAQQQPFADQASTPASSNGPTPELVSNSASYISRLLGVVVPPSTEISPAYTALILVPATPSAPVPSLTTDGTSGQYSAVGSTEPADQKPTSFAYSPAAASPATTPFPRKASSQSTPSLTPPIFYVSSSQVITPPPSSLQASAVDSHSASAYAPAVLSPPSPNNVLALLRASVPATAYAESGQIPNASNPMASPVPALTTKHDIFSGSSTNSLNYLQQAAYSATPDSVKQFGALLKSNLSTLEQSIPTVIGSRQYITGKKFASRRRFYCAIYLQKSNSAAVE